MLVRCLVDDVRDPLLGDEARAALKGRLGTGTTRFAVTKDCLYVVYAVSFEKAAIDYFVIDDDVGSTFPIANSSLLFEVADRHVSRHWLFASGGTRPPAVLLAPRPWASQEVFYEQLVDGVGDATTEFRVWKERLDLEFPYPGDDLARDLEDGWIQCTRCSDAWTTSHEDGSVRCPSCRLRLRNPAWSTT